MRLSRESDDFATASSTPLEYRYSDAHCACSSEYLGPLIAKLLDETPETSVIADAGCGNGSLLAALRRPEWEMHGLEISSSGLEQARKSFPGIHFHAVDLSKGLPYSALTGKCDVVISTEVIEHMFLPRVFVKNCRDLLKPNGTLILSTPYHGYAKNLALAITGRLDNHFTALWDYGHIKFWSRHTLRELLIEGGFRVEQFRGAGRIPFFWKSMVMVAKKVV